MGYVACCYKAFSPYTRVWLSWTRSQWMLVSDRAALRHWFFSYFLWTEFLGWAKWQEASSESHLCFLRMMWFCWRQQVALQLALKHLTPECEVLGMKISISNSEAMIIRRKGVLCPLQVRNKQLYRVEGFSFVGVWFMSEGAGNQYTVLLFTVLVKKKLTNQFTGQSMSLPYQYSSSW